MYWPIFRFHDNMLTLYYIIHRKNERHMVHADPVHFLTRFCVAWAKNDLAWWIALYTNVA